MLLMVVPGAVKIRLLVMRAASNSTIPAVMKMRGLVRMEFISFVLVETLGLVPREETHPSEHKYTLKTLVKPSFAVKY